MLVNRSCYQASVQASGLAYPLLLGFGSERLFRDIGVPAGGEMRVIFPLIVIITFLALTERPIEAQTTKVPRVGIFGDLQYPRSHNLEAFRQGLRELGYVEGQNIIVEPRYIFGNESRLPEIAAELVRLQVDVIVVLSTPAIYAAIAATKTIPIVITFPSDPAITGFTASLERPGGNVTGVSGLASQLGGKWLELIKETIPGASRVAVLWDRKGNSKAPTWNNVEIAARSLRIELQPLTVENQRDLEGAFKSATAARADAFVILPAPVLVQNLGEIAYLGLKNRLPGIFWRADFAEAGGLMAYGANRHEQTRRAAYVVDKILKGAKPAELPVETPTRFELVINLKTAKEIGIVVPPSVLAWADRVIR
ncbi:MAG TPA: ABC transporter substrate-binding protein [Candidatus Binatia bacterium]